MISIDKYIVKNNILHMVKFNNIYLWDLNSILTNILRYNTKIYVNNVLSQRTNIINFIFNSEFICEFSENNQKMILKLIHNNIIVIVEDIQPIIINISSFNCSNHSLTLVVDQEKYHITAKTSYDTKIIIGKFKFKNSSIICEKIFESYHISHKDVKTTSVLEYASSSKLIEANKYFNDFKHLMLF